MNSLDWEFVRTISGIPPFKDKAFGREPSNHLALAHIQTREGLSWFSHATGSSD
jgi:hypothetical protein